MFGPRIQETSTTTGTGDFTLAGSAGVGLRTFNAEFGTTKSFSYAIVGRTTGEWEEGIGYLTSSTNLVRKSVIRSSNSNALVNFTADTKDVFNHLPPALAGNGVQAVAQPAARMHFGA